jgi:ubiquinol-cytochrome c reductase cytochrome b subunit
MGLAFGILVLLFLPFINTSNIRASSFRPLYRILFWVQLVVCVILGWIGQMTPETPYIEIGQLATVYYFGYFLVLIPLLGRFENKLLSYK